MANQNANAADYGFPAPQPNDLIRDGDDAITELGNKVADRIKIVHNPAELTATSSLYTLPTGPYRVGNQAIATALGLPRPGAGYVTMRAVGTAGVLEWRPNRRANAPELWVSHQLGDGSWAPWQLASVSMADVDAAVAGQVADPAVIAAAVTAYLDAHPAYPLIIASDNPTRPTEGRAATYLVTPSVTWPANLLWSLDPDASSAPTLTGNALVTLSTVGGVTHAIVAALFPRRKRPATAYSLAVAADNPIAYWRLDETTGTRALDDTETHDGVYGGTPALGAPSLLPNNGGSGVTYPDRTNNAHKVAVNHAATLNAAGPWTIELWVKLTDTTADATQQVLDKTAMSSANGQYGLMYDNRSSQGSPKRFRAQIAGAQLDWPNADTALAAGGHLVITVSGSGSGQTITMYFNGVQVAQNTTATVNWSAANTLPLTMCARGGTTDEIALYSHALTAARVAAHYAAR